MPIKEGMLAKLHFYPVGNADSTLIHLNDGRLILKDYFNTAPADDNDKRIDLDRELRDYLDREEREDFDVVAFSHADDDHCHGAEDFFWFDYAEKYQGEDRIKMTELWVAACFILETGLSGAARVIQKEAKHRFKAGYGIRVFGNPEPLETWLTEQGIDPAEREHLITHAGTCVPGFTASKGQVEIFSHSPFSYRMEGEEVDRNGNCLVWHLTFFEGHREMRCIQGADAEHPTWADIVYLSELHDNEKRLDWDVFRTSHHCSYTALSENKGKEETTPREEVASLFDRGSNSCILIASCDPIPSEDTDQPPHRQAKAYYRRRAREKGDEKNFIVTMEWPDKEKPKPLVIETTQYGFRVKRRLAAVAGAAAVVSTPSPRFGQTDGTTGTP
jgi:hypothetical protein